MCGRFTLTVKTENIVDEFDIDEVKDDRKPSYNIAPGQKVAAIIQDESRRLGLLKWGLILAVFLMVVEFFDHGSRLITAEMREKSFFIPQLEFLYAYITDATGFDHLPENLDSLRESNSQLTSQ